MTRRSERKKAAKAAKAAPPPDFVHMAAGKVGPLVHGAADRIDPMAHSAADWVGAAADRVGPLTHAAADRVSPLALSAADLVGPYAQAAMGRVSPYAHLATAKVGPLASGAKKRSAHVAQEALEKIGPRLDEAIDAGRHKVSDDLIPKLAGALSVAAGSPIVAEATRRGQATLAAAKGELVLPPPKKKRRWLKRFAVLAALAGVAAVAARKFLGSADADWQAARPSAPYTPPPQPAKTPVDESATSVADTAPANVASVDAAADVADLTPAGDSDTDLGEPPAADSELPTSDTAASDTDASLVYSTESDGLDESGQPMESQSNEAIETELPIEPSAETATGGERPRYEGEGIYIGLEPPEGYTIKGNERSKKYHVPESAGYGRTTAEVWFNSEEAAERAGFVRAQR